MWSRPIPRFSPTFSPIELRAALRSAAGGGAGTVEAFEAAFAQYIGVPHAVMAPSARVGLFLLLEAWGFSPGDEILIPSLTYFAIPSVVLAAGLRPVFVDVGRDTFVIDPEDLEGKIGPRSRAIIPTHLYGLPCDMAAVGDVARRHGLKVIEDVAQATGARFGGQPVGRFGDAAYYTFGLTKNITTLKGAMVTTGDAEIAAKVRDRVTAGERLGSRPLLKEAAVGTAMMMITRPWIFPFTLYPLIRAQGLMGRDLLEEAFGEPMVRYDEVPSWFFSSAPGDMQAAVGLRQLERIDGLNALRASHGRYLLEHLGHGQGYRLPQLIPGGEPIFMSFPIQVADPEGVKARLLAEGVDTARGYMRSCADMELYSGRVGGEGECPNAAAIEREILHIPVHPNLSRGDLSHLVEAVRRATL